MSIVEANTRISVLSPRERFVKSARLLLSLEAVIQGGPENNISFFTPEVQKAIEDGLSIDTENMAYLRANMDLFEDPNLGDEVPSVNRAQSVEKMLSAITVPLYKSR